MFRDPVFVSSLVFVMYFFLLKDSLSYSEFWFLSGNNNPSNRLVSPVFASMIPMSLQYPDDFSETEDVKNPLIRDIGEAASPSRNTFC
jgi:hypothetical protein